MVASADFDPRAAQYSLNLHSAADGVLVPGGSWLLTAQFARSGEDLVIHGADGQSAIVAGYLATEHPAPLTTDSGARLEGSLVELLAGPRAPLQFAELQLAQASDASGVIGKVLDVQGVVNVSHADGSQGQLGNGDPVFLKDVIQAASGGKISIGFVDGTSFALSDGARMTLDELVFNPGGGGNVFSASVLQGTFVFLTGQIAPSGNMEVTTPVGTIGVRGTKVAGKLAMEGSESVIMLLPDPNGHVGVVDFANAGGTQTLNEAFKATSTTSFAIAPSPPFTVPPQDIQQLFDDAIKQLDHANGTKPGNDNQGGSTGEPDATDTAQSDDLEQAGEELGQFVTAAGSDLPGQFVPPPGAPIPEPFVLPTFITVSLMGGIDLGSSAAAESGGSADLEPSQSRDTEESAPPPPPPPTNPFTVITGGTGNDSLGGGSGRLQILGNAGDDALTGGDLDDLLDGGDGDDVLDAGSGDDQVQGGAGNDLIIGGSGAGDDSLDGGAGSDTVKYESATQDINVNLTTGKASGDPQIGSDTLINIENVIGGSGNDTIVGNAAANRLEGGVANDTISGLAGDDTLVGGAGNDQLTGGVGNDLLQGGSGGFDVAVFSGNKSDYTVIEVGGQFVVTDQRAGGDGVDTLDGIESVTFADQTVDAGHLTNQAPTAILLSNATVAENAPGAVIGSVTVTDPDAGDTHTFTVSDPRFTVTGGQLTLAAGISLDFEAEPSLTVQVTAKDSGGFTRTESFTINVTDVNEAPGIPIDKNAAANQVAENAAAGSTIGITAFATDPDGDSVAYSLSDDAGGRFTIDAASGVVTVADGSLLDFESAGAHSIRVRVTSSGGLFSEQTLTINVANVDEALGAPVDVNDAANTIAENAGNGATVGITASAIDPDAGDTVTYSLTDNAGGRFAIDPATGIVTVANGSLLDFESAGSHTIAVQASSSGGTTASRTFTISVTNVNDPPGVPTDANSAPNLVAENAATGTVVGVSAMATDPDVGDPVVYALTNDAEGRFAIDATTGVVTVADGAQLDYETAPSHQVTVRATSSEGLFSEQTFTVNVSNVNELGPVTDGDPASNTVIETGAIGTTAGITGLAIDPDAGDIVTYSLTNSAGGRFAIDPTTGVVTVATALEVGSYSIEITATDDHGLSTIQTFSIDVTAVDNLPPSVPVDSDASVNGVAENAATGALVGITAFAADPNSGDVVTYSLIGDAGGRFAIDANTGVVSVANGSLLDFESAASHTITVRATSNGGLFTEQTFAISVTDVSEPPSVPGDENAAANSVAENAATGTLIGITAFATDPEPGDVVTYSLTDDAGGRFAIAAGTGEVTVANGSLLDFEGAASHTITIRATSNGALFSEQTFTINVANVNEPPSIPTDTNAALNQVAENAANGTAVGVTAAVSDPDAGDTVTYSLTDSAGGRFAIDANTGVVTVANGSLLNFESATSHAITVQASSSGGLSSSQIFTISVDNVNEPPSAVIDGNAALNLVAEDAANGTTVGITASAIDPDAGDTITYSLTDDAGGRFAVDAITGVVTVANGSLLDFESATSHAITVQASSSGGLTSTQTFTIGVTNLNELGFVTDNDPAASTVAENAAIGTAVGITGLAVDPDAGDSVTYSLTDDGDGLFAINAATGTVTVAGPLTAGSHSIEITATDNHGLSTAQTFSIDVTSVGNAVPVLVSNDLVVAVGGMDIVQESELETTDSDNAPNQIVYTLTTLPALGILLLSGQALALGGTFTQQDIADGLLRYLQDGAGGGADTFTVSITDGSNTLSSQVISITIAQEGVVADGDTSLGDPLIVGDTAFGRLDVVGGSAVSAGTIIAGNTATGDGNIRLDGTGSTMSAGVGGVTIGNHGMGQLLVEGGATIEAQGSFENLVLGSWSDGFGQAIVSGAGSSIIAKGTDNRIVVGYDGSGNLLIENGGLVSALSIDIGRTAGSTGLVTVTGAGSALIASNDFGLFSDRPESAGFVRVGQAGGSIGELDVMDGGSVEIRPGAATDTQSAQLSIAQDLGSIGNVLVSGTGSNISIFQDPSLVSDPGNSSDLLEGSGIVVGQMGQASMSVTDGATVEVSGNESYIGVGIGNLADTDDTTPLPLSTLSISLGGNVTLTETLAAVSNDSGVYIGDMKNGNGLVTVDGTGSLLSVNGTHSVVVVGRAGNGQLIVSDGGTVAALWLDVGRSGSGAVTIEGAGSKIVASNDSGLFSGSNSVFAGFVRVGGESGSHGALTIIDGGLLEMRPGESINTNTTGAGMNVAQYAGSTGIVSVSGSGSAIVVEGDDNGINIGRGGNGFLSVTGGGQITTQFIQFGRNVGSVGTGVVSGVGSKIDASGFDSGVAVGRYGTGSLTIDDGGFVTTDFVNIGRGGTGVGTILVTGAGSMLVTDGANDGINVGREGQGVLEILDGGQVQTGSVVLAHLGGSGAVIVSGSGSTLQVDGTYGDIIVGRYGQGTFLVQSSGHVEARYFEVGHVGGGVGDVVVSGTGSQLITAGEDNQIGVGREGAGTLIVQEGGLVKTLNLQIGRYGSGAVSIDGAGTQVIVSNDEGLSSEPYAYEAGFVRVTRGDGAVGTLSITNGAHLDIRSGISQNTDTYGAGLAIGYEATSSGHVTVAGAGSRIQITQEIVPAGPHYGYGPFISINGQGSLTVQNLGQVSVTGPYASLDAGGRAGSNVHVVVTNGGSIVVDGKDASINVGQQGTGTLEITGGGSVTTEFMNIANGFGSTGTVLVSGAGSELITAGLDNTIQVGRGGTGALTVENGGLVKALNFVVGRDGTGTATIDGAGSKIVVSSDEGLNAEPYTYESGFVRISRSNGSTGTLNVVNGGELEIRSGIGVNTDTYGAGLAIGRDATSAGHVLVSGEGSLIHITQDVVPPGPLFGSGPYARLNGQAVLTIEDKGQLVIEGPYAAIRVGGREGSNAHMEVLSGGSVLVDNKGYAGGLAIGGGLNTAGSVHVGGAGSSIILAGEGNRLMLGTFGDGSLLIDDGGLVKTVAVDIGYQGSGSITVSGSGSSLIVSNDEGNNSDAAGNISIYSGSKLEVVNGGRVEVRPGVMNPNGLRAGIDFNTVTSSAAGTLRVAGVGSIVLIQQTFVEPGDIGNFAGALLDLHNGAVATIEQSGKLEIDGPGSNLSIGGPGEGRLEVLSGGTVILDGKGSEAGMFVGGGEPNWSGSVVISGSGSSLTVAGGTYAVVHVGYVGESRLTVASGGTLISGISGDSVIDVQIFSNGVLDGGGGTIKGDVYIDNGGQLLAGDGTVTELSIDGNLLMNNSSLSVDASADSLSDRYIVTGQVDIWSAQFEFNFVGGYLPQEGDGFNFMKAAAINVDLNNLQYVLYGISADGIFDFNITNDGNFLYFNSLADTTASDGLIYRGSASHDFFVATTGSDEIHGGAGDDELFGDAGNDFIAGGSGQDKLDGGSGMDSFFYQTPSDGTQTAVNTLSSNVGPGDQISNFDAAVDKFVFNAAAFNLVDISSLNFAVSDAVYDGSVDSLTNGASADYQDGKASFIVDSANHLIYDDNGAADGYTVVATVELAPNSPAITESNLQAA